MVCAGVSFCGDCFLRPKPHLQPQPVGNHRDKFAVGGFSLDARDCVAEVILQGFDVTAVPRNLDRVPDGALHAGGGRLELFSNRRIQHIGDGADRFDILDRPS